MHVARHSEYRRQSELSRHSPDLVIKHRAINIDLKKDFNHKSQFCFCNKVHSVNGNRKVVMILFLSTESLRKLIYSWKNSMQQNETISIQAGLQKFTTDVCLV